MISESCDDGSCGDDGGLQSENVWSQRHFGHLRIGCQRDFLIAPSSFGSDPDGE